MYVPVGRDKDCGFAARKFSTPLSASYDEVFNFAANFFGNCEHCDVVVCILF